MAMFKPVIRRPRKDGFFQVYIRVMQNRKPGYIKTDKMITKRELTRKSEIADAFVLQFCTQHILDYQERLNRHDISQWTGAQVVEFLTTPEEVMPFSDYARKHIDRMIDRGQERNARKLKPTVSQHHWNVFLVMKKVSQSLNRRTAQK